MDELLTFLKTVRPDIDFTTATNLVSGNILKSIDIITITSAIESIYGVEISLDDLKPENYDSLDQIKALIEKLKAE
ncbi:MAG: acyl carrier protein [Ruminococcaceae bacterium]|nr:acyl carrier protein [Oscillospiraceae bacterium]